MQLQFTPAVQQSATASTYPPPPYDAMLLPGAEVCFTRTAAGDLLQQEVCGKYFRKVVFYLDIREPVTVIPSTGRPAVAIGYMLRGNAHVTLHGITTGMPVRNGLYYPLPFTGDGQHRARLKKGIYSIVVLLLEDGIQEELKEQIPGLIGVYQDILRGIHPGAPQVYPGIAMEPEVKAYLNDLLRYREPVTTMRYFLQEKVTGLIRLMVNALLHPGETGEVHELRRFLDGNLDQRFTAGRLSTMFETHRYSLTLMAQFKKEFGLSPTQYHIQQRMAEAMKQVQAGAPVTTVAELLGYKNESNFCNDFKAYYKQPPSAYRAEGDRLL